MYRVQCTVYSVQCTVYSVQCTGSQFPEINGMLNSVKMQGTNTVEPLTEINTDQLCMNLVFVEYKTAFYTVAVIPVYTELAGN